MKNLIRCLCVLVTASAVAEPSTNVRLRVAQRDRDGDGTPEWYSEALQMDGEFVSSYMQQTDQTEIGFWFDETRTFTMTDTNRDGRFDRFVFSTDMIPQQVLVRNANDELKPMGQSELQELQEKAKVFVEGFGAIVDLAASTNEQDQAMFGTVMSNLCEVLKRKGSQPDGCTVPTGARVRTPAVP